MMLNGFADNSFVSTVGWSLVHSLWQIPISAGILYLLMIVMRRNSANLRYLTALFALTIAFAAPLLTVLLRTSNDPLRQTWNGPSVAESEKQFAIPLDWNASPTKTSAPERANPQTATIGQRLSGKMPSLLPWIVFIWLLGIVVYTVRLCRGWKGAQSLRRSAAVESSLEWKQRFESLVARFGVSGSIRLAESILIEVPTVIGWLRPVILAPPASFTGLSVAHLEAVLAHELAHIKRHDYFVNLVQSTLEMLMFYHPAVWWISGIIRLEREQACDDLAVSVTGDPLIYAHALVATEQLREGPSRPLVMAATGESLGQRVRRLVQNNQPDNRMNRVLICTGVLLVVCVALVAVKTVKAGREKSRLVLTPSEPQWRCAGESQSTVSEVAEPSTDGTSSDITDGENPEVRRVAIEALKGREGTVVIMDPRTGHVYTVVNQDWAIRKGWSPASTTKLITGMAAIDMNLIDPDQFVWSSSKRKSLDMTEAVATSDNAYFRTLGSRVGAEEFLEYARGFGFGERTGIELENESEGFLPAAAQVHDAGRLGSYGEGIQATPIQLATFVAALANGGKLLRPIRAKTPANDLSEAPVVRRELDLHSESLRRIIAGMTDAVAHGTGVKAQRPDQVVVGKTATSESYGASSGLFISYAPAARPRVVVVVGIRGQKVTGAEAAGVAGIIYQSLGRLI